MGSESDMGLEWSSGCSQGLSSLSVKQNIQIYVQTFLCVVPQALQSWQSWDLQSSGKTLTCMPDPLIIFRQERVYCNSKRCLCNLVLSSWDVEFNPINPGVLLQQACLLSPIYLVLLAEPLWSASWYLRSQVLTAGVSRDRWQQLAVFLICRPLDLAP